MTRDRGFLFLAFAWLAATAWLRPLAVPDEGRYVGVAWDMLRTGDWLVPRLDGLPYFHKPPLFYWLTAAAMSVSDSSLLAARFAPWLGACLAAASLFLFARRWFGNEFASWTLLALVTAPLFFFGAQYANLDMLVAGCITATILAFAHAALLEPGAPGRTKVLLAGYALCALGVLAKGLIGIVLPGMVLVLWLVWERRWMAMVRLLWLPGIALFFVVAAPWFIAMQERFSGFMHYFFIVQHFQRFATSGFNNAQPFWFYVAVLAVLALPWTLWLAGTRKLAWRGAETATSVRHLMLVWLASITLFFSIPNSKLVGYIFPVVVPLIFLAVDAGVATARPKLWRTSAVIAAVLCLVAAIAIDMKADRSQAVIGNALRERIQPGDAVIALEEYRFAIPLVARLESPMVVVSDWSPQSVASRDNWRKELADAAVFAPSQDWLISEKDLAPRICAMRAAAWLVGDEGVAGKYPWLQRAEKAASSRRLALWRIGAASPVRPDLCRGTPSASSGGRS
ncbi:MAG TPA: glycosyltransferase family 39 protein [Ramlibacter sp.]|nr:glycosyltransferase family 39 protein [Ramlibacter sp.]